MAKHGMKMVCWDQVAEACNVNRAISRYVTSKSAKTRFEILFNAFTKADRKEAALSGVGGGVI